MDKLQKYYRDYYTNEYNKQKELFEKAETKKDFKAISERYFISTYTLEIGRVELSDIDLNTLSTEIEAIKGKVPKNCINTSIDTLVNFKVRDAEFKMHYQPNSKDVIGCRKILEKLT